MNRLLRIIVLAISGGGLAATCALADDCCTLRGQVVSSVDGAPVRGALVQLSGEAPQSAMTGADGTFAIANLKPGDFTVHARKPGYFTPDQLEPSVASAVPVHLDANATPLLLKLIPEGVVSGRILDESGEPVEGMQVWLQATKSQRPASIFAQGRGPQGVQSNELGEFRIAGIPPGAYLVLASAQSGMRSEMAVSIESVRQNRKGYPVTYYPGTINQTQAVPVRVKAGSAQQLNIRVTKQPLYRIAGHLNEGTTPGGIMVILVSQATRSPFGVMRGSSDGSFVFPEVSPGEYLLWAAADSNGSQNEAEIRLGARYLHVTGNVVDLSIPLMKVANAEIQLRWELSHGTHAEAPAPNESLPVFFERVDVPQDSFQALRLNGPENEHGVAHSFLEPGTYRLRVRPDAKTYVARATSGGTDLLREDLVVGAGSAPSPIEIVLRDDGAQIDGTVVGTAAMEEGHVFAVPESAPKLAVSAGVSANGSFHFVNLAPGRYSIVALQNAEALDLEDAQSVSRAERMGESTELQADTTSTLQLEWKHWDE